MIGYDFEYLPERLGEARVTLANTAKALELLNWKPQVFLQDWIAQQKLSGDPISMKQFMKKVT